MLMTCSSYGVFFGLPSASLSFARASEYFFAFKASCAAFNVLASSLLTFFSSAANAGLPGTSPAAPTTAALTMSAATRLDLTFIMWFGISCGLVFEFGCVHEPDLLHPVALRRGQHLRHEVVLHTPIGAQVDLRLRVLSRIGVEVALEL